MLDYYHFLAKTQHGASAVNQLPWEFYDKVNILADKLDNLSKSNETEWPILSTYIEKLKLGKIDGVSIQSSVEYITSNLCSSNPQQNNSIQEAVKEIQKIAKLMSQQLKCDINEPVIITNISQDFRDWKKGLEFSI